MQYLRSAFILANYSHAFALSLESTGLVRSQDPVDKLWDVGIKINKLIKRDFCNYFAQECFCYTYLVVYCSVNKIEIANNDF